MTAKSLALDLAEPRPNPFLPDGAEPRHSALIQRPIDNTVLSAYMRCPSEAFKAYFLHRRREGQPSPALAYGSGWHTALEAHYKAPECSEDDLFDRVHLALAENWQDHGVADDHRTFDRCFLEYKKYVRKWGLPWKEEAKTLGWPKKPLVEIATEIFIPGCRHPYTVKIDHPIKIAGNHFIEDHKTASRYEEKAYFRQYYIDNQMMGYCFAGQLITGQVQGGVRINLHVIHKSDSMFERRIIPYGQDRLKAWARNYDRWLARMERDIEAYQELIAKGFDMGTAMDMAFPLNKWACHGRKYGHCSFVDVCGLPEHLRQHELEDKFQIVPWNPLETAEDFDA